MHDDELRYWLALLKAPYIGYKAFSKILTAFSSIKEFFYLTQKDYQQFNLATETIDYLTRPDWRVVDEEMAWRDTDQRAIVTLRDEDYPPLLSNIVNPPPILFVQGELALLKSPQIALVGSRNASVSGKEMALQLAGELTRAGLVITSGLANGIDTMAHLGAIQSGKTIAVLGTGLDVCYPSCNRSLVDKIGQQGAIVSEFSLHTPPHGANFPRRNRVISGLSLGVVVVEANLRSGSLITANYALDQGREVFAVPGSIYNPTTRGCHFLIKQGAKLVENAQDILEELSFTIPKDHFLATKPAISRQKKLDDDHRKLLECIGYEPTKIDILIERSNFSIQKVTAMLIDLELLAIVYETPGGYMRVSNERRHV